jgi:hypothetical protein
MNNVTTSASNPESPQAINELDSSFDIKPSAEVSNHLNARMKYLQRLAHQKIWLPPVQQPKLSQNLIVFDWDDTLFPTTHLHPVDESEYALLIQKHANQFKIIEDRTCKLLETCIIQAKVVIITNARKGWVEFSSKSFLPKLHALIMKYVKIISARVAYEHLDPYDTLLWKQMAFTHLWDDDHLLDKNPNIITNVISFGDSNFEMEAASAFAEKSPNPANCYLKLIKLKDNPTFDELKGEMEVVLSQFNKIFASVKNLKIKLEKGGNSHHS